MKKSLIEKFIGFLETNSIYLARLDTFEDSLENISPYDIIEITKSIKIINEINPNNFNQDYPITLDGLINSQKETLKKIKDKLISQQKYRFASCWVLNDVESFAMWDMYAKDGVVIRFERKYFEQIIIDSIPYQEFKTEEQSLLAIGKVLYQNFNMQNMLSNEKQLHVKYSAFRKHQSFKHEDEYRLVLFTRNFTNNLGLKFKIPDIESLEINVIASPRLSNFQFNQFQNIINKYSDKIKLKESQLKNFLEFKSLKF